MHERLRMLLERDGRIEPDDVMSIHFDRESFTVGEEIIFQFAYFTINMIHGEYLEVHENQELYVNLSDLYASELASHMEENVELYVRS
ncbi:hypothetical protein [Aureibacillus halotolerans]|uniref:Uncharacterized protein n=1 Tax=Aureibacillus halotolerans TaxID=1508390 RepID=A0A4R6UDJ5_9BACI|nr:hypothetical protein [Aureibacillus halotolerans]TDQ42865.1 hypothetical protein EV213_101295 [Aureibacillus halotolerans]